MRSRDRPTPVAVLPATLAVESMIDPTAEVVAPTAVPTVEVVDWTVLPTPPSKPALLDEELAEVLDRADPLALALLPKSSSSRAVALVLALVIELIVAVI